MTDERFVANSSVLGQAPSIEAAYKELKKPETTLFDGVTGCVSV